MKLTIEVSDADGEAILAWAGSNDLLGKPHCVFVTSSVPALHMWNVDSIEPETPQ